MLGGHIMNEVKQIWKIAGCYPMQYIFLTIESVVMNLMKLGSTIIYGALINLVANGTPLKTILIYCGLTFIYVFVERLISWHSDYAINKYCTKVTAHFQNKYIHKLLNTHYSTITTENSARYLNNINNDIQRIANTYVWHSIEIVNSVCLVIGSFIAVLVLNWKILVTMMGFVLIMAILPFFLKKRIDNGILAESKAKKSYIEVLKEYLLGITTVKNFCAEESAEKILSNENEKYVKVRNKLQKVNGVAGGLGVLVRELAVVSLIALTCYLVYVNEVGIGSVLTVFSVGNTFFSSILGVSAVVTYLFSLKSLRNNVFEIMDSEEIKKSTDIKFNDKIKIDNIFFNYPNRDEQVINGLSIDFEKNKKYLILGKSGSGKSTLLKLLATEYPPTSGVISIDGKPYSDFTEKDINAIMSVSRQQGYIFGRTLKGNIDFLSDGDEQKLQKVIECCKLQDFIARLPEGINTVLDEEINQVSGGEKLRINLARAIYRESDILLLDEVTSALDKSTSEDVEKALLAINDKTIINVCHKFNDSTLSQYDKIYIIENGQIVLNGHFNSIADNPILSSYRNVPSTTQQ